MPTKHRFSASEIAAMQIPGLPTTKARVIERAAKEGWKFEDATGRGGVRRMYELPKQYLLPPVGTRQPEASELAGRPDLAGTIAGGRRADPVRLSWAVKALEEWATEEGVVVDPERKGAIIAVLYDYLERGAGSEEVASLLQIMKR